MCPEIFKTFGLEISTLGSKKIFRFKAKSIQAAKCYSNGCHSRFWLVNIHRAVIGHVTCCDLNWPKIKLSGHYFVLSCALDTLLLDLPSESVGENIAHFI